MPLRSCLPSSLLNDIFTKTNGKMSWDYETRKTKCPCGGGTIEQEVGMDDWSRTNEKTPVIKCAKCADAYNLVLLRGNCPYSWKGAGDSYYLVPKEIDLNINYDKTYPEPNEYMIAKDSFPNALIVRYKLADLENAYYEVEKGRSIKQLTGIAKSIASFRLGCFNSAKINILKGEIKEAIEGYDAYNGNHEQILRQKSKNETLDKEYRKLVIDNGIPVDF